MVHSWTNLVSEAHFTTLRYLKELFFPKVATYKALWKRINTICWAIKEQVHNTGLLFLCLFQSETFYPIIMKPQTHIGGNYNTANH